MSSPTHPHSPLSPRLIWAALLAVFLSHLPGVTIAQDRAFIDRLNTALDAYGQDSGLQIRYENVEYVDSGLAGQYYSFEWPEVTFIANGIRYAMRTRTVALIPEAERILEISVPDTFHINVSAAGTKEPPETYKVQLTGVPAVALRQNHQGNITQYRIEAPEEMDITVTRLTGSGADARTIGRGTLALDPGHIHAPEWSPLAPIKPAAIAGFANRLVRAANQ